MTDSRMNVYLCQFSFQYGNEIYLPYSVGTLWAYAQTKPEICEAYTKKGFVFVRKDPDETVAELDNPAVMAFSTYVWNWEMSIEVAQRVKATYPECLIVFGGPQIPDPGRAEHEGFLERFPFIDIIVHGEGEITFGEILLAHAGDKDYLSVAGLTYGSDTTPTRQRATNLDQFPSPYLTGVFDELYELDFVYNAVWESNRGCPYQCTFCDWGSLTAQKLYLFDEERLRQEVEVFGEKKVTHVYMGDANFGILPRDVGIARHLADTSKKTGGFPSKVRINYAKNTTERVHAISTILNESNLDKGITLSVQSMDPHTLGVIKRKNLKYDTLSGFIKQYQTEGIDSYTEVIIGLPGETYETFRGGIDTLLGASAHDSLWIYRCTVLPNAPMNSPSYRKEYEIKSVKTPIFLNHTVPGSDPVQEYEWTVSGTSTLSEQDVKDCIMLSWAVQTFHALNLTQVISIYANVEQGLGFSEFYERLITYAKANPETLLGHEYSLTTEKIDDVFNRGGSWDNIVPEYTNLTWANEEASYLRIALELDRFYSELEGFIDQLETDGVLTMDDTLRADMMRYQSAIVVKSSESGTDTFTMSHALHAFHRSALTGDREKLQNGGVYELSITDPYDYSGDLERYAREIVFWGRRGGKSIYQDIREQEVSNTPGGVYAS